jgi:hypothetical protein
LFFPAILVEKDFAAATAFPRKVSETGPEESLDKSLPPNADRANETTGSTLGRMAEIVHETSKRSGSGSYDLSVTLPSTPEPSIQLKWKLNPPLRFYVRPYPRLVRRKSSAV